MATRCRTLLPCPWDTDSPRRSSPRKSRFPLRDKGTQKTFTGDGSNLPATLVWDGKSDAGLLSPEGIYTATLAVDYGTAFAPATATSKSFILDVTAPTGSISLSSSLFSP